MRRTNIIFQIFDSLKLHIVPGFTDNYFYILENSQNSEAAVIDPGDAAPIVDILKLKELNLKYSLITHHHQDHIGGVEELQVKWPMSAIICSPWLKSRSPWNIEKMIRLAPGQKSMLWDYPISALDVRGHTLDHIAFTLSESSSSQVSDVFVGDSLFGAGCGGLFEGTYAQMLEALRNLASLPENVRLWCAHEYTIKNLRVAMLLNEKNPDQSARLEALESEIIEKNLQPHELMTVPLVMREEKLTNPFLRCDTPTLQKAIDTCDELAAFTYVRKFRDQF